MNFYLFNKNTNYDTQKIYIKKKYKPFFLGKLKRVGNLKKDGGYLITKKSLKIVKIFYPLELVMTGVLKKVFTN